MPLPEAGQIVLESVNCDLCTGNNTKLLYRRPDLRMRLYQPEYSVIECINCGHRFVSPRPTKESTRFLYPETYYTNRGSSDPRQHRRYIKQMSYLPQIKNGKILDIGCAGGAWLQIVKQNGWECYGVDFVESGQNQENIEIRYGYLPELSYPEEYFDVITAWGVLEHVHEPSRYFETVFRLLKKKGAFIFMVPNGDSLWSRWAYKEDTPRHLHSFRPSTLKKYAQKYGYYFKKIDFTNDVYSHPSSGRGMIKRQLLRKFGIPWSEIIEPSHRFTIKALGKAAGLLDHCLIHPKIEKLFHVSGTIVVILTKEI